MNPKPGGLPLLFVTQYFWPEAFRVNDLVEGLLERGHALTVLTGLPNYPSGRFAKGYGIRGPYRERYKGAEVLRVPLVPRGRAGPIRLVVNYFSFASLASMLAPFLCASGYDAIFVFETSPITVALPAIVLRRLRGIPVFLWVQDPWPESVSATGAVEAEWILHCVERLVRFIYDRCDEILVQSMAFVPKVHELARRDAVVRYLPNWAESEYRPVPASPNVRAELPDGFRIIFAGNIGVAQSFETILEAAAILRDTPEIQWVILGDGRQRPTVERTIEERSLSALTARERGSCERREPALS